MGDSCAFCEIVAGRAPAEVVQRWGSAWAIEPLKPVTPGHLLVISTRHVADVIEEPRISAATARCVAWAADGLQPCNVITSVGADATQTVHHLHWHIVPRRPGDGLLLPWTRQEKKEPDLLRQLLDEALATMEQADHRSLTLKATQLRQRLGDSDA